MRIYLWIGLRFCIWFVLLGGFFRQSFAQIRKDRPGRQDLAATDLRAPDFRGPIRSDQFTVHQSPKGIFATGLRYKPFPAATFTAKWIGMDPQRYPDQQLTRSPWTGGHKNGSAYMMKFKKLVRLDGNVQFANIRISADLKYRLFINGVMVSRGPAARACDYGDELMPTQWYYDQFDNKSAFKKGINSIAVEVSAVDRIGSSITTGRSGLILEADVTLQSGKHVVVQTDPSWVCDTSRAYFPEMDIDASRETDHWYTDSAYDPGWSHAVVIPDSVSAKWNLIQSELPQMMETRILPKQVFPIHFSASPVPNHIRLEFDRLYTGYLGLKVTGKAGTRLRLVPAETENQAARDLNYTLRDGVQTYEFPELTDAKYIDLFVTKGSTTYADDLTLEEVVLNFSTFPVDYTGSFHCSDPMLNALWENIRWVTQQNMQTYHMDSPIHQEPTCDAGDYLIESMVNYYTFSSPLLVKQDLRKIASLLAKTDFRMFHTCYQLLWLQMLLHYYEYTGDKALLQELSPAVYGLLAKFHSYIGKEGLVTEAPNYMFMDWEELYGRGFHHPPASWGEGYMTTFYYEGLRMGSRIADYLGQAARSAAFAGEADTLKTDFSRVLFDVNTGLFKNGVYGSTHVKPYDWLPADTAITYSLPYVNVLAVLYGLAPADKVPEILRHVLTQQEIKMSPYFMYFVLEAIAQADRFDEYGFDQLHRWSAISGNPVGLREGWAAGDYSHAWGGSPAYELSSKVLGVYPSKPGFAEVTIFPHPGKLSYASGVVATPKGPVSVSWQRSDTAFSLKADCPAGMKTVFLLPLFANSEVFLNGKLLLKNQTFRELENVRAEIRNGGKIVAISVPGGKYVVEVRADRRE